MQGTLEMLILRTLAPGARHGFGYRAERSHLLSNEILKVEEGSLYPALRRLGAPRAWCARSGAVSDNNRRARF